MKVWCNLVSYVRMENSVLLEVPDDITQEEKEEVVCLLQNDVCTEEYLMDYDSWDEEDPEDVEFESFDEEDDIYEAEYTVVRDEQGVVDLVEGDES